jgi:copper homeostasis protein (lipoprotein)
MTIRALAALGLISFSLASCLQPGHAESADPAPSVNRMSSGIELEGMFRYFADAAVFRDCRTNQTFPVAMEGEYLELERAYLNSGIMAGDEVYTALTGRYLERPAMDGNHNIVKLIVNKLNKIDTEKSCAPETHADLFNTYWKLVEVSGRKVTTGHGMPEAHLILASTEARAHGNSGCNNFFGSFETGDDNLTFGPLASTMKACPSGMDTERVFLASIGKTTRFEISGQALRLYADDELIAVFEAVYL